MKSEYDVIIRPLLTEKGAAIQEKENKILLEVAKSSNKIEIKRAIEKIFSVKVDKVSTINYQGKKKRLGKYVGRRSNWKKAVVKLREGEKVDFLGGKF